MSVIENRLAVACSQIGQAATECMDWVSANGRLLGAEGVSLLHELHANEVAAERLKLSAGQPPAVGFVGPRRSGKTSAIIPLVRGSSGRLGLRFEGIHETVDYVGQISPDGKSGQAMTVRLSDKRRKPAPKSFPIAIQLLSIAGIIKVLGSAFLSDAAARDLVPTLDDVRALSRAAGAAASDVRFPGLVEEDIWEVRAYFAERFGSGPAFKALSAANYWQTLAKLAPYLGNAARGELLQLLWGGLQPFTRVFTSLAGIIESLGGALEAHCALNALVSIDPRTGRLVRSADSIIDGSTAAKLGVDGDETVLVCNEFGLWTSVPRSGLSALATEMRLTVGGGEGGVLERADVLEFPGIDAAPSHGHLVHALATDRETLGKVFLRAKAVYLLDRYIVDHKVTSMVVCIDPATREVGELAPLVQKWVERTHGPDPHERERQDSTLFLALTKMDKGLTPAHQHEWDLDARLRGILLDGFGRQFSWPHKWIDERPFDGVFLLRSPNVRVKHLIDYAGDGSEIAFKPAHHDRIERARAQFHASDVVRRHFADPAAAWREVMLLNDGGISYLAQSIAEVCTGRVKRRQLALALDHIRLGMRHRLQRYFLSDSFAFQRDGRHASGLHVARRLKTSAEQRRFGHLLRALQMPDAELADVLQDLDVKPRAGSNQPPSAQGLLAQPPAAADSASIAYAQAAVDHWVKSVRALAMDGSACQRYRMPRQALLDLVDEMIIGAVRLELDRRIAEATSRLLAGSSDRREAIAKAAACASRAISDYVTSLGFDNVLSNAQPRRKGRDGAPIFAPRGAVTPAALADATVTASSATSDFNSDWMQAFLSLVDDNVTGLRERDISDEQNRQLGRLLKLLDTSLL